MSANCCRWPRNWRRAPRRSASVAPWRSMAGLRSFIGVPTDRSTKPTSTRAIPALAEFIASAGAASLYQTSGRRRFFQRCDHGGGFAFDPPHAVRRVRSCCGRCRLSSRIGRSASDGTPVLIIDGEKDSRRSPGDGARLAERLTRADATVTHRVLPCGHAITTLDQQLARAWLRNIEETFSALPGQAPPNRPDG